jgi:hypothetical protein
MVYSIYLKNGTVYLPAMVNQGTARYMEVEPVTVVSVADTVALRGALQAKISKPNDFVAPSIEDARKPAVVLKYSGDKSWSAFMRGTSPWEISEKDGKFRISGHRVHRKGYWEVDPDQMIHFPVGTALDEVIDRMIAILQDAAEQPNDKR